MSAGTSWIQHCGCTSDHVSLSIILYVKYTAGIAQSYSEIREVQSEVVALVIDFYQATLEIEGSEQVWGRNWIASLPATRKANQSTPALLATMRELVDKGAVIPSNSGGYDCNCCGCVKPEDKHTSYTLWAQSAHNALHNKPFVWREGPKLCAKSKYFCSKCPGRFEAGMLGFKVQTRCLLAACKPFLQFATFQDGETRRNLRCCSKKI